MEHLYIVAYDIRNEKRWRRVFRTMNGFGAWLQLSLFQCRLDRIRLLEMEDSLRETVNQREDHVLIVDLGPADNVTPRVRSIGKAFAPVNHEAVIV